MLFTLGSASYNMWNQYWIACLFLLIARKSQVTNNGSLRKHFWSRRQFGEKGNFDCFTKGFKKWYEAAGHDLCNSVKLITKKVIPMVSEIIWEQLKLFLFLHNVWRHFVSFYNRLTSSAIMVISIYTKMKENEEHGFWTLSVSEDQRSRI